MSDRLELADVIVAAGIERDKAERLASVLFDTIRDNVATKADVAAVRADLGANAASLKADIAMLRSDLRMTDSAGKADIAAVESKLTRVEHRLLTRLGAVVVVAVGIILAAMRYLPPVH